MAAAEDQRPAGATGRLMYRVQGMDCAEEVAALRAELLPLAGVDELTFDVLGRRLTVHYDPTCVDDPALRRAVSRAGMEAEAWTDEDPHPSSSPRRTAATATSGLLLAGAFVTHALQAGGVAAALSSRDLPTPVAVLYLLALAVGAAPVLPGALYALRRARPDMHLLMTVAVLGALGIGEWFEAATVSFLFSLSLLLESWSTARARASVTALLRLTPTEAHLLAEPLEGAAPHLRRVSAADVAVGSLVLVHPGERLPLDGTVVSGHSGVDASPITGESVPVATGPGQEVFAGCINGDGALEIRTTHIATDTYLAHILRTVEEAQGHRSPSERFVERFARIYTPAIMILALATCLAGPLLAGGPWSEWFYAALVLLVISCPCALVISTPVSIASARACAARMGVLIKGGLYLEQAGQIRCLALDKTGTLTAGMPSVSCVLPLDGHDEAGLLALAAAIESRSSHPLAQAIVQRARQQGLGARVAAEARALGGRGVTATVEGQRFWLGSHRLLEERGQETPAVHATLQRLETDGHSVVVLGNDEHVCGFIALRDEPRQGAAEAVAALHDMGLESVVMLTGDNRGTADRVARRLGIDDVRAELLPADKVTAVADLVDRHGQVAMVGDGVNDAPAMARASLGVAMGAAGTDVAIETADIVILSEDLRRLPWLVAHSRRTLAVIRQNIVASVVVKALFLVLAYLGWATLWGAIAADMGVSLAVVANALRLLRPRRTPAGAA